MSKRDFRVKFAAMQKYKDELWAFYTGQRTEVELLAIACHARKLEKELVALASGVRLKAAGKPVEAWVRYGIVWSSTYRSQGYGMAKYTEMAAELEADEARMYGIPVELRKGDEGVSIYADLESELAVEILKRKPHLPAKEWVRRCWARGVNPRVYNPYLPVGFEERVGLDYFGGEKR